MLSSVFFLLLAVSWAWMDVLSWQTRGPVVPVGLWMVSRASLYTVGWLDGEAVVSVPQRNYVLFGLLV